MKSSARANASSPLLCLPQEIKNQIYELVIDARTLHIYCLGASSKEGFSNYICVAEAPDFGMLEGNDGFTPEAKAEWYEEAWGYRHETCDTFDTSWKLPFLLLSCRQVWAESRLIPYSRHTFQFNSADEFGGWVRSRSPAQAASIRNIQLGDYLCLLSGWNSALEFTLGRLRGLRHIELVVHRNEYGYFEAPMDLRRIGRLNLGLATLIVWQGTRQVAFFSGTHGNGMVRSISESEMWG